MSEQIREQLEADALKPAIISGQAGSVTKRPLRELIEADQYLRAADAAEQGHFGIRISQIVAPGGE